MKNQIKKYEVHILNFLFYLFFDHIKKILKHQFTHFLFEGLEQMQVFYKNYITDDIKNKIKNYLNKLVAISPVNTDVNLGS